MKLSAWHGDVEFADQVEREIADQAGQIEIYGKDKRDENEGDDLGHLTGF